MSSNPNWCKACITEVLQISSGKSRLPREIFLGHIEHGNAVVAQPLEKNGLRNAGEFRGRSRPEPPISYSLTAANIRTSSAARSRGTFSAESRASGTLTIKSHMRNSVDSLRTA